MEIFVGGLRPSVRTQDINHLVRRLLRGPWYKLYVPQGGLADCKLLQLIQRANGKAEYCAVIVVEPHRMGWKVLQGLQNANLHGQHLRAHRWFARKGVGDRRAMSMTDEREDGGGTNRRSGRDRRRALDVRAINHHLTEAVTGFERSYGN
jgi:hypothetical protein